MQNHIMEFLDIFGRQFACQAFLQVCCAYVSLEKLDRTGISILRLA